MSTLAEEGAPLANTSVSVDYVRDLDPYHDSVQVLHLMAMSRADGVAWFTLPDPGVCDVRFSAAALAPEGQGIGLRGRFGTVAHSLVRSPERSAARLRVVLRDCEAADALVEKYCFQMFYAEQAELAVRLCSENAPTGVFTDLRAGAFTLELVPRYAGEPAYYFADTAARVERVTLVDGQETLAELCAVPGCRMSLLVESAGATRQPASEIEVRLVDSTGNPSKPVWFRRPNSTGVTVQALAFGEELLTESLVPAGDYDVVVTARGFAPGRTTVALAKGRSTRGTCVLQPLE